MRRVERQSLKRNPSRKHSSTRWLQRQLNDPYVQAAKQQGYRARSVFKLEEIDKRFELIKPGRRIADLGAAPGSWSQYAKYKGAKVVAIDLLPIEEIDGVTLLQGDFLEEATQDRLRAALGGPVDLILSDIAPQATGRQLVDRLRAEAVGEAVLAFAIEMLDDEGRILIKLVKGAEPAVMAFGNDHFRSFKVLRPKATRSESSEVFLLISGRR